MKLLKLTCVAGTLSILVGCGGGGGGGGSVIGGQTSNGNSNGTTTVTASEVVLSQISLSPSDVLATTAYQSNVAYEITQSVRYAINKLFDLIVPSTYAVTGCGLLCSPSYPPVNFDTQQQLTSKLSSGSLVSLSPVFTKKNDSDKIECDFTNAGILVNSVFLTNLTTNDAIANITSPATVDSNCKLTFKSADYFISGTDGSVYKLDKSITGQIFDIVPANDPAFNTSNNALIVSVSGEVSEISISTNGVVTQTQLTTSSAPLTRGRNPNGGVPLGSLAYDGNYLVGVAANFSGLLIYQKGTTNFRILRDTFGGSYYSVFFTDDNKLVWGLASSPKKVVNLTDLSVSDYDPSGMTVYTVAGMPPIKQYPTGMFGANGRYNTIVLSDRCMLWDTSGGDWMSLLNFPSNPSGTKNDILSGANANAVGNASYSYARISKNFAYCVASTASGGVPNYFARYDIQSGTKIGINLDSYGFLASGYQIFANNAFATVTNTSNSDVQYIEMNLETGAVVNRGVITVGTRKVAKLIPIAGNRY